MIKAIRFTTTILAPAGVEKVKESIIPTKKQIRAIQEVAIITCKKLLNSLIAVREGKIIKLEIINAPISLMPITTVIAVQMAMSKV